MKKTENVHLSDLLDLYMTREEIGSRALEKKTRELMVIPRSTIENWRNETSKRIRDWKQAIVIAFLLRLKKDEVDIFLEVAKQKPLSILRVRHQNSEIWQQLEVYAQGDGLYQDVLESWWGIEEVIKPIYEDKVPAPTKTIMKKTSRKVFAVFCFFILAFPMYWFFTTKPSFFPTTTLLHHNQDVHQVAWGNNSNTLASSGEDTFVIVWDIEQGIPRTIFSNHHQKVRSLAWCADGNRIASGDDAHIVFLWDAVTGKQIQKITVNGIVRGIDWNPDCDKIAISTENSSLTIWDTDTGELDLTLQGHTSWVRDVDWSSDGSKIASVARDNLLIVWDAKSGSEINQLAGFANYALEWSPDDTKIASVNRNNGQVVIWDTISPVPQLTITGHKGRITNVSWHPDGNYIVTSSVDRAVKVWNINNGELIKTLIGHRKSVWSVDWSPDGQNIASGDENGGVLLWNLPQ